jgi:lipoic acid synthetase
MRFKHKPDWLKITLPKGKNYNIIKEILTQYHLNTVCQSARCPNLGECWGNKTATFMILGDVCTRNCKFCAVRTGNPKGMVDKKEPKRIAQAVEDLALNYVVITSVTRDDLSDGGAEIFTETIKEIRQLSPKTKIEVLIPDFAENFNALEKVVVAHPDVLGHNLETVSRLTPIIRDQRSNHKISLDVLQHAKKLDKSLITKSSFMVGLGETIDEIYQTMHELKRVTVDIITIGQYLQPTKYHLPVSKYIKPDHFELLRKYGLDLGFNAVLAGPLVRSSYHASELIN